MLWTPRGLRTSIGLMGAAATLILVGCASSPPKGGGASGGRPAAVLADGDRDGAEARPPAGLDKVPDAEPRVEPIRVGGPNKPYEALGRSYVPLTEDRPFVERGLASWYGRKFHGRRTSSGEPYDMYAMSAAHPTLPIPSYARVRNPANGREVIVRVNDRGPFHSGRIIDLSYTAALRLDLLRGVAPVEVERITYDEIRAGTWRRPGTADATRYAARAAPAPADVSAAPTNATVSATATAPATTTATAATATMPTTMSAATTMTAATTAPSATSSTSATTSTAATTSTSTATATTIPAIVADPVVAVSTIAAPTGPAAGAASGFWVQLAAFRQRDGATAFQRRIAGEFEWLSPWLAIVGDATLFRLQAGPYPSRDQARDAAESIRAALQLVPVIVERR